MSKDDVVVAVVVVVVVVGTVVLPVVATLVVVVIAVVTSSVVGSAVVGAEVVVSVLDVVAVVCTDVVVGVSSPVLQAARATHAVSASAKIISFFILFLLESIELFEKFYPARKGHDYQCCDERCRCDHNVQDGLVYVLPVCQVVEDDKVQHMRAIDER